MRGFCSPNLNCVRSRQVEVTLYLLHVTLNSIQFFNDKISYGQVCQSGCHLANVTVEYRGAKTVSVSLHPYGGLPKP